MSNPVLTMIPGPTPVHERVLEVLARPTVSHQYPAFVEAYSECLARWRTIGGAASAQPFVVSGSGTFAMEMALVNLVAPGERLLVVSHGFFGDRWEQIAAPFGIECDLLRADWGRAVSSAELGARELEVVVAVEQDIDDVVRLEMATRHDDTARAEVEDAARGIPGVLH